MKGLLYREVTLAKKFLLLVALIFVGFLSIHIMFLLSYRFGNLSHDLTEGQMVMRSVVERFYYAELLVLLCGLGAFVTNIYNDVKNGWLTYGRTLPGGMRRQVRVKYLCVAVFALVFFAIGYLNAEIVTRLNRKPITGDSRIFLVYILLGALLLMSFIVPVTYRFKNANTTTAAVATPIMIGYFAVMYWVMQQDEDELPRIMMEYSMRAREFLTDHILLFVIGTIVVYGISCLVSVRIMERKEK